MRFVVYGAGAVGGVLGGHLALNKHDVLLVCRGDHADKIGEQKGLRMKSSTGDYFASLEAAPTLDGGQLDGESCLIFATKSNETESSVAELAKVAPQDTPVVSFQNGVQNEAIIAKRFTNVFGGVCRMTCSFLQPGQVSFRKLGGLTVGHYPKGANPFAKKLGKLLEGVGFSVAVSNSIMCDKWQKLLINLQSAYNAIIDPRDHDSMEFTDLKIGVLEEGAKVLRADKIRAKSCDEKILSVVEVIDELKKPLSRRASAAVKVNNSTWQNLYLKRKTVENAYFHTPIIAIARKHDIPVPFNEVALELVTKACEESLGPGMFRASEILAEIQSRSRDN
jgi:2-dehydropantoate 2-reductase